MDGELAALLTGRNVCTEAERRACHAEHGGFLDWACEQCSRIVPERVSPQVQRIVFLRRLQRGGYPFRANDLSVSDWLWLGRADVIEEQERLETLLSPWRTDNEG